MFSWKLLVRERVFREGTMNWKKYFEDFKDGDRVRLIKRDETCHNSHDRNCCGEFLGHIGTVEYKNEEGRYSIRFDDISNHCTFPKECLERAYDGS